MRVLGSYALVYLLHGAGQYRDGRGIRKEVRTGDLLLLFPEIPHAYGPPRGGRWDEIYLVFDGAVFDLWRKQRILSPHFPVYHLEPVEYWFGRFQEIVVAHLPVLERICRLQAALADVLANYQRDPSALRQQEWLASARALLGADIGKELYVPDVARQLGMSHETFRKKFTRLAGMSPWRYRMLRVIDRACALVHAGRLSCKEIAEHLGFNDEFHFSRRFKQITGRSPTQFRALSSRR